MTIIQTGSANASNTNLLKVERPYYEQEQLNNDLKYCKPDGQGSSLGNCLNNVRCGKIFKQLFPVLNWMSSYNVKQDIVGDIISGCTVAVMHIPQGMYPNK